MCSRLAATSFVRSQPKPARTGEGLHKNIKKVMHRVPSRGVDPRVKFLDDANATHSSSFERTPTPVLCKRYASSSFAKLRAIEYLLPDETYSSSAFVSLQILIAFAPNPTYTFSAASATRGACRFLSKQARRARLNKREEQDSNSFSTSGIS